METGIRVLLLTAVLAVAGCATTRSLPPSDDRQEAGGQTDTAQAEPPPDENNPPPRVIEPEVERRKMKVPRIESSNLEVGLNYGALSIEDFGTNPSYGATLAYHVTEDFFLRGEIGRSTGSLTSFEVLSQIPLLNDKDRRFTYYDLALGYNFLPGEAFIGKGIAISSSFYITGGIGGTDFGGDTKLTGVFGAGYQVVPTDWFALHIEVQDHVFQSSLLGSTKLTNNIEARIATTVFF
jgi:outer membrane beta-barrel protein